ncbi:uncharacterized protein LOC114576594 [Exaiptasia diaphana]|uniref:WAP domain-containing protein n=1 Tax=Exaiptasia diaphana TaxID=2652724 RepID=A0A913YVW8_EXADI|nr:uncharacterized protein LOC114576594 [Exaiptasia diaphana]
MKNYKLTRASASALHELDTAPPDAESGSGNGSGDGSDNDKSEPKKETQADETSGSGDSDIDTKVLQQTIMKMKKEGLLEALTGSIINRGSCPDTTKLSCLNLLYSFSCNNDDDCFENGMTCCATRCTYGKKMCVPRVSAVCPLRPPYYQGYKPCKDSTDCGKGAICCLDMAGRHYCNTVVGTSNLI